MAQLYLLAHFDDEYGAAPLILARHRAGLDQRFVYACDYRTPDLARRRHDETRAFLAGLGLDPAGAIPLPTGVQDGALHTDLPRVMDALRAALPALGPVEGLTVAAWEGGHPDHDACAGMAVALQAALPGRPPIDQFSLYHGRGLPGPLFRACDPIPENGPLVRVPATAGDWIAYAAAVRRFGSQWRTWAGLWPSMFASFALRGGFHHQALDPARVHERPHAGPLLYERRFGVSYDQVRAAIDSLT